MRSLAPTAPRPKRQRVVVAQSKGGCLTCKARRVKCDEAEPLCVRCTRAGKLCEGYAHRQWQSKATVQPVLGTGFPLDPQAGRLYFLATNVLSPSDMGELLNSRDSTRRSTLLQLAESVRCVKIAAIAFGAAYECFLSHQDPQCRLISLSHYGHALRQIRHDFETQGTGRNALALASFILACVEILNQHQDNALKHFLGACRLLEYAMQTSSSYHLDFLDSIKDDLLASDVLISSYTMSQTPAFVQGIAERSAPQPDDFNKPEIAIQTCMHTLHRAYRFVGKASHYKYCPSNVVDNTAELAQQWSETIHDLRQISQHLGTLLEALQPARVSQTKGTPEGRQVAELHALRTQLTSALIFISSIRNPFEVAYDEYMDLFRDIITHASAAKRFLQSRESNVFHRFVARPGVLGPLSLVAMKCRDPSVRRMSLALLRQSGREGPLDGHTMAAIGKRLADIEEGGRRTTDVSPLEAKHIAEQRRVHGYAVEGPIEVEGERRFIPVRFVRPNPPFLHGWRHVDYTDAKNHLFWYERVEI